MEGIRTLVWRMFSLMRDNNLFGLYEGRDLEVIQEKYTCFIVSLADRSLQWCGKSMQEAHSNL